MYLFQALRPETKLKADGNDPCGQAEAIIFLQGMSDEWDGHGHG